MTNPNATAPSTCDVPALIARLSHVRPELGEQMQRWYETENPFLAEALVIALASALCDLPSA